jgi:hypothetical protein
VSPCTTRIAELNDQLRETFLTGRVMLTSGIAALQDDVREEAISQVRCFSDFTEDNDPYGEHDFGLIEVNGVGKIFWKISYYDQDYQFHSPDPADPKLTRRVLTIMLAEEY